MKITIILLLLTSLSFSQFRETKWDMSKMQVKAIEKSKIFQEYDDMLIYSATVANKDAKITYYFVDDKLFSAGYIFDEKHTNDNEYIYDFNDIYNIVAEKYGKASKVKMNWKNELYKDDVDNYGFAISLGHLEMISEWGQDETYIKLSLSGENYIIKLILIYGSFEHLELYNQKKKSDYDKEF